MRKRDLLKYLVDSLIEDNLPLVVTTAQPTCLPPDLAEQSKVGQMLPLHLADQTLAAQLMLGPGASLSRVYSQVKDLLDRPQYQEMCQNPLQARQTFLPLYIYRDAIYCAIRLKMIHHSFFPSCVSVWLL
jgi:hypothetical protein